MEAAAYSKRIANERRSYSKNYTKNNCVSEQKSTYYSFPDSVKLNSPVRNEDFPALSAVSMSSYKSNNSNCDISSTAKKVSSVVSYSDTLRKNTRNKTPRHFDQNINYSNSGGKVAGEMHKKNDSPAYHRQAFNVDNHVDSKSSTSLEGNELPQSRMDQERRSVFRNISAKRSRNLDMEKHRGRTTNTYKIASGFNNELTENKCPQRMQGNPSMRNTKSGLEFTENEKQTAQSVTSSWKCHSNHRNNSAITDSQNQHNHNKSPLKPKRQIIAADDHSSDRHNHKDNHHSHNPCNVSNRKASDAEYQSYKQQQLRNSDLNKQQIRNKESNSHNNNDIKITRSAEVSERYTGAAKGNAGSKAGTSSSRENFTKHPTKSKPEPVVSKKRKCRLSKIKRQTAFQTGKVLVLSPEFHSRIVKNLTNSEASVSKNDVVDIDNLSEYPSLATPHNVTQTRNVKGPYPPPCSNPTSRETSTQCQPLSTEAKIDETKNQNVTHNSLKNEKLPPENEIPQPLISTKDDADDDEWQSDGSWEDSNLKVKQCPRQPIQLFDILAVSKPKEKPKKKVDIIVPKPPVEKVQTKVKKTSHAPNLLDSSAPNIKRGKEREHPKQKKKTALKRIIISERMKQQELMTNMESHASKDVEKNDQCTEGAISDNATQDDQISPCNIEEEELTCTDVMLPEIAEDFEQKSVQLTPPFYLELELIAETAEAIVDNVLELAVTKVRMMGLNVNAACFEIPNFLENDAELCESVTNDIPFDCDENSQSVIIMPSESLGFTAVSLETDEPCDGSEKSTNIQTTPSMEKHEESKKIRNWDENERFKAVQAVIHVKHFREYCTQLLSKELNEAVLLLIDNLARFQDRQHQKDPVKARMKRRLTYGIKEVKKYLKLKKLRCVVIAPDLEDIKAEGGLNAELASIIKTTKEFHIPCIFAAGRKHLGRVCHKPVPVSCLGIFSYEGSEVPYKKIIELYEANAKDYQALVKIVNSHITDNDLDEILEAKETCQLTLITLARSKILTSILSKENENTELPTKYNSNVLQWFVQNYQLHISV